MCSSTSRAARESRAEQIRSDREHVLAAYMLHGSHTPDEIAGLLEWGKPERARRRCSELKAAGRLYDTGSRRRNESGCWAAVLAVVRGQRQRRLF